MALTSIDSFLDELGEDWMRTTFVERLENARLLVDDEQFGSMEGMSDLLSSFMRLSADARRLEVVRLRVVNTCDSWASDPATTVADINSVITSLRAIRDAKLAPEPEPEDEEDDADEGDA